MTKRNLNDYSPFNGGETLATLDDGREATLFNCRLWKSKDAALAKQLNIALENVFISHHSCGSEAAYHSLIYAGLKGEVVITKTEKIPPLSDGAVD